MQPLQGKKVLVTRGKSQARRFTEMIEGKGGVVRHTPLLTFQLNDSESHEKTLHELHDYSWIFLTSSNAVKFFFELLKKYKVIFPKQMNIAIIGSKTKRALQDHGYEADFLPTLYRADKMGSEFFQQYPDPGNILYIRGNRSRDVLPTYFKDKGVFFQSLTVYDTLLVKDDQKKIRKWISDNDLDALTFTSPSTIQAFLSIVKGTDQKGLDLPCFCIGPTTAEKARSHGFKNVMVPLQYTIQHMFEEMVCYFSNEGKR
ncbi:uroporphyrinogen-III synthase [Halobacillus litoralis]|uniref:uroporphyrinogen-III synthase n=1 Tax=Halobacillus litoralis TaxID=45668 RepID=UPI001CFC89F2|nr:uroporphyrinogen-III synthase [Halobacillus litoralis]